MTYADCSVCGQPITNPHTAVVWCGPDRKSAAAHADCLTRLGEHELGISR